MNFRFLATRKVADPELKVALRESGVRLSGRDGGSCLEGCLGRTEPTQPAKLDYSAAAYDDIMLRRQEGAPDDKTSRSNGSNRLRGSVLKRYGRSSRSLQRGHCTI
jgi:hypothetical protein